MVWGDFSPLPNGLAKAIISGLGRWVSLLPWEPRRYVATVHSAPSTPRLALPLCLCLPGSGWGRRGTGCWRRRLVTHLPSWAGICLLPLFFLQLEFSMGRWKHGFPPLIPFLATNSVGWGGLASYEMRKRTVFLAGSREERFNLFSVCVHVCACVHMRVYLSRKLFSVE